MMVARKPGHQGEHEGNRNTIAQGRPGDAGEPVVDYRVLSTFCTRGYGCAAHPAFPAPSLFEQAKRSAEPGRMVPGYGRCMWGPVARMSEATCGNAVPDIAALIRATVLSCFTPARD